MKPDEQQIRGVVHSVWSTQLGVEITDTEELAGPSPETLTASIQISGDFHGAVRIKCSRVLVRRAAATMFSMPEDDVTGDDERDVIGELTNVVAGNIKATIPGRNSISLPTIVDGTDYQVSTVDVSSSDEIFFTLDGEAIVLTLVEHTA